MKKDFFEIMEKSQSPRMTDSEYRDFLKKQKIEAIKETIAGVGFGILWILLLVMTAIF